MKRVLSSVVLASGLLLGSSLVSVGFAAEAGAAKPDAAKGEQLYVNGDVGRGVIACVTCHGAGGNSTIPANPNLAAQPYEYLIKQLNDFRPAEAGGKAARGGPNGAPSVMAAMAAPLTPDDMKNIALYLSLQPMDPKTAATATQEATMQRGQHIWRGGLPERNVPACAGCHSANGAGLPAEFPRLSGQFPTYIQEQVKLFRSGDRNNNVMMRDIADRMNDADIAAVSDYAAGLR